MYIIFVLSIIINKKINKIIAYLYAFQDNVKSLTVLVEI